MISLPVLEQFQINMDILAARMEAGLEQGETILQVIQGGLDGSWQEVYAEITKETRTIQPPSSPTDPPSDDPGPSTGT